MPIFCARAFHRVPDRVLHAASRAGRFLREAAQRTRARTGRESPLVMTGPLIVLAIPAALAGFGFVANTFPALAARTPKPVASCRFSPLAAMLVGVVARLPALPQSRKRPARSRPLAPSAFTSMRFYGWLIGVTQELLAQHLRVPRSLDSRCRRSCAASSGATWGFGSLLRLLPSRQPAGLFVSLRPGHRRADLLHRFPMILLFIVFCPLLAALADSGRRAGAAHRRSRLRV